MMRLATTETLSDLPAGTSSPAPAKRRKASAKLAYRAGAHRRQFLCVTLLWVFCLFPLGVGWKMPARLFSFS